LGTKNRIAGLRNAKLRNFVIPKKRDEISTWCISHLQIPQFRNRAISQFIIGA
jgi:hypothetical protein